MSPKKPAPKRGVICPTCGQRFPDWTDLNIHFSNQPDHNPNTR